jgi:anaerobic magnesium-protoporphyrin IX monomethyl ester cyclase
MAQRLLLVEPPKKYWFIMGDYTPPPTALLALAAYVEQELPDVEVDVLDCQGQRKGWRDIQRHIGSYRPSIVATSGFTCNAYVCARLIETAKALDENITTVAGGQHFSFIPEESLADFPEIDIIVRGEGEETLVELIRALGNGGDLASVEGISFRHDGQVVHTPPRPLIEDLDTLPYPAYHLVEENMKNYHFTMMAGRRATYLNLEGARGCDHRCKFCTQWNHWGGVWRTKSPKRIADEIEHLYETYGGTFLWLTDDNFDYVRRGKGLYEELRHRRCHSDIMLFFQARTDEIVKHPDLAAKMRDVGHYWVLLGVENDSDETLREYRKGTKAAYAREAVRIMNDNDVFTNAMFVIGSRKDTHASIGRLREFSLDLGTEFGVYTALTPFPGTEYYDIARQAGWIEDENYANYDMAHAIMPTETLTRREVQEELYECYRARYGRFLNNVSGYFSKNKIRRTLYRHMAGQSVLRTLRGLV